MKVERIELPENLTVESAYEFVGRIAAVCTGAKVDDIAKNIKRGKRNITEAYGDTPTRAWEFLPVDLSIDYNNFRGNLKTASSLEFLVDEYNCQVKELIENFHIFHITAPRYVMAHLKTHTTLSSMMSSVRIGCNGEKEYEFPELETFQNEFSDTYKGAELQTIQSTLIANKGLYFYENYTPKRFHSILKSKYKRKEIIKRPLSDFEVIEMKICGYSYAWDWFIKQRTEKGVQKETIELAKMIDELIKE